MRKKYVFLKLIFGVTGFSPNQSSHQCDLIDNKIVLPKILFMHGCVRVLIRFDRICSPFLGNFIFSELLNVVVCTLSHDKIAIIVGYFCTLDYNTEPALPATCYHLLSKKNSHLNLKIHFV